MNWFRESQLKIGDKVFCAKIFQDVVLLEIPSIDVFSYYDKYGVLSIDSDIKVKTLDGQVREVSIAAISKISKGNYFIEYEIGGLKLWKDKKNKAEELEYLARNYGFRVEREIIKNSIKLRIFGDSQEEVNNFIALWSNPNVNLWTVS